MNPELYIVIAVVALAAASIAWRIWQTLRVARGDKACNSCGCDKDKTAAPAR